MLYIDDPIRAAGGKYNTLEINLDFHRYHQLDLDAKL